MIAYDNGLIVKNAQTNIDQTASALNYALTAMESLMALGFEHSHSSINSVSSTVRAFDKKAQLFPLTLSQRLIVCWV